MDYTDYGYKSLAQLCTDLGDCFNFIKPGKGDIKIYDKSVNTFNTPIEDNLNRQSNTKETVVLGATNAALPDVHVCYFTLLGFFKSLNSALLNLKGHFVYFQPPYSIYSLSSKF